MFLALKGWVNKCMERYNVKNVTISGEAGSGDRWVAGVYPELLKKNLRLASLLLIKAFVTSFKSKFDGLLCCVFIVYNVLTDMSMI